MARPAALRVGQLGRFAFPAGYYVYTGSAMNGLGSRLARHRRRRKKLHWHIDYLLRRAKLVGAVAMPRKRKVECARNRRILRMQGGKVVAPGFGSSDCRCRTHLVYFGAARPSMPRSQHCLGIGRSGRKDA
ncbi:MAG: GIY-YIG nuclease family protein [Armatimonadota bacterium]|nr:MAG: GIY-YIG nuclease family protein [Armatimonadota bacterium]